MFKKVKKWLEKMAEQNEKRYGNQKLDCCGMNRNSLHAGVKKNLTNRHVQTTAH
jgi:hypothetical protein